MIEPVSEPGTLAPAVTALDPWSPAGRERQPVVELRGVSRTYGSDPPVQALRGVDLTIYTGDWVAIVGPSGSGKSTLLNILGCLDRPTAGTYLIDGIDASGLSEDERASLRARSIGFVFQTFHLLGHRTALENVMLADVYAAGDRSDRGVRARRRRSSAWGSATARTSCPPSSRAASSSAWRSRGRCSGSPRLLLCDEPTGNLDTVNTESVLSLFDELGE